MNQDGSEWDERRATVLALKLLARREHATAELDDKLRRRGVPDSLRAVVLRKVIEWRAVDDRRMAHEYVRVRRRDKGRYALLRDLEARGVGDADREAAVAELTDEDQRRAATDLLERQRWRFSTGDGTKNAAKAAAFLARRGFDHDVVRDVVESSLEDLLDPSKDVDADARPLRP